MCKFINFAKWREFRIFWEIRKYAICIVGLGLMDPSLDLGGINLSYCLVFGWP